jgi:hypothetical protein
MRDGMHTRRAKPRHPTISTTLSAYLNPAFQPLASGRGPLRLTFGETRESDSPRCARIVSRRVSLNTAPTR